MIENLRYAARNHLTVWIGGGEFSPRELADAARRLEVSDELLAALQLMVNYENLGAYGRADAMKDARAAIAKATGGAQ